MVSFMLLAAPRSGTTWAANWLTTDTTLCLHDPTNTMYYTDIDKFNTNKLLGISDTGLALFPEWVNQHPARKIVLHRDINEINQSLDEIGIPGISAIFMERLDTIKGIHLPWTDLFGKPEYIYEFLLNKPFDKERHQLLRDIEMQPNFVGLTIGHEVAGKLFKELLMSIKL